MTLADIADAMRGHRIRITDHADEEAAAAEALTLADIHASVFSREIIEQYPTDRPYPSCLVYGPAPDGAPVHRVWAYNEATRSAVLVTVYRPDPERWVDWRRRRPRS